MNRYVLGIVLFVNFGINYVSAIESATVDISYVSGETSVFHSKLEFYSSRRADVFTAEEIMDHMNDKAGLDEFAKLHLYEGKREFAPKHEFTIEALSRVTSLTVTYRREENTPGAILGRRITWLVDDLDEWLHPGASLDLERRERIRKFVEENHVDKFGRPRSLRELRELLQDHNQSNSE